MARLAAMRFAKGVPVEDTEQYADACLGLVMAEDDYDPDKSLFSSWAFRKARKQIVNGHRQRRSLPTVGLDEIKNEPAVQAYDEPEEMPSLDWLLQEMPDDDDIDRRNRSLMIEYFLGGISQTSLASRLGLTKMAVSLAIKSAIRKIRRRLGNKS